jgi:hypothetical protein
LYFIGGTYVPPNEEKKKKKSVDKVVKVFHDLYSVHSNKMYRSVCHVPAGEPATCSLKACLASKELSERNNTVFSCSHIEDVDKFVATAPQEELSTDECRYCFIKSYIMHFEIEFLSGPAYKLLA